MSWENCEKYTDMRSSTDGYLHRIAEMLCRKCGVRSGNGGS